MWTIIYWSLKASAHIDGKTARNWNKYETSVHNTIQMWMIARGRFWFW